MGKSRDYECTLRNYRKGTEKRDVAADINGKILCFMIFSYLCIVQRPSLVMYFVKSSSKTLAGCVCQGILWWCGVGERKLFLLIEGSTEISVKWAKAEIMNVLQETTEKALRRETQQPTQMGKYSVL
eukprot:TRINITY_DN34343_c0_g1_i1.p2 TRINITY_DN34343_c0_g1~~TRINITY_DN34343_c0_g1_i1.p2  ORF type:complete len:127 (+),score=8.99 TRINITY_DN34343_c0_g1_i1:87-467(+)